MKITDALKFISIHVNCLTTGHSCPLSFQAGTTECKIKLVQVGQNWKNTTFNFSYKTQYTGQITYLIGTELVVQPYQRISFYGFQPYFSQSQFKYFQFVIESDSDVKVYGSVMSLINFSTNVLYDFQFTKLFQNCSNIISAPILPAKHLKAACYFSMFRNCIKLKEAPILPASILKQFCYAAMFQGCVSLQTMPTLRALQLKAFCYLAMFQQCSSLKYDIELPAETLVRGCYAQMFEGCYSIRTMVTSFEDWNTKGKSTYYWVNDVGYQNQPITDGIFKCSQNILSTFDQTSIENGYAVSANQYHTIPANFSVASNYGFFQYNQKTLGGTFEIISADFEQTASNIGNLTLDLGSTISATYVDEAQRIKMGFK